jgi:hypothetical protein
VHCFASLYANQKFNLYRLKFIKNIYWSPKSNLFELTMFNGQKTVTPNKFFMEIYTNEKTMKKIVNYKVDLGQLGGDSGQEFYHSAGNFCDKELFDFIISKKKTEA